MEPKPHSVTMGPGPKLHITQSDLLCKTGCGFFGNIAWQGYCSKCYKEYSLRKQQQQQYGALPRHLPHQQHLQQQYGTQPRHLSNEQQSQQLYGTLPRNFTSHQQQHLGLQQQYSSPRSLPHEQQFEQNYGMLPRQTTSEKRAMAVSRSFSDADTFFTKPNPTSSTLPRHGFSRFEEKKRHNQEIRSTPVKSLFRKGPTKFPSPKTREKRSLSPDSQTATQELGQFLQTLPDKAAHHAYNFLKVHVEKLDRMASSGVLTPDDISERVHTIYQSFDEKIKEHSGFSELSSSSVEPLLDHGERYLTRLLYRKLFCPINCDDEERDLAIQKRIRSLNWISAPLLDCRINELDSKVRDILEKAITHLIEMDGQRAPQDKLTLVISCSKLVFEMLSLSKNSSTDSLRNAKLDNSEDKCAEEECAEDESAEEKKNEDQSAEEKRAEDECAEAKEPVNNSHAVSADDFLPALIFVVLRANPPRIHSNLNFITRFAAPGRLMQGEGGYYFTNLCCAVSFLENLTSDSLNLPSEEFDRYMSGKSIPFASLQAGVMVSEGLRLMYQNMSTLSELRQTQKLLQQQMSEIKTGMTSFNESILKEVTDCLEQFPIQIRGKRAPVQLDDEQPDESNTLKLLPPPLLPQKVTAPAPSDHIAEPPSVDNAEPTIQQSDERVSGDESLNEASVSQDVTSQELNSYTVEEQGASDVDDDLLSTSLKVQGRVIPCIPCDTDSPSSNHRLT